MRRNIQRTYELNGDEVRDAILMWFKAKDVPQPPGNRETRVWVETGAAVEGGHEIETVYVHWTESVDKS